MLLTIKLLYRSYLFNDMLVNKNNIISISHLNIYMTLNGLYG